MTRVPGHRREARKGIGPMAPASALGAALLGGALAACSGTAGEPGPPLPYVFEGACPFECCTYGEWTAERDLPVYPGPNAAGSPHARIDSGRAFEAVTGRVLVREPVRVRVEGPLELVQYDSAESVREPADQFRARPSAGDSVVVLSYRGEAIWNVWYRGEVYQTRGLERAFDRSVGARPEEEIGATLERRPVTEWWVRVRAGAAGEGWILMDEARVDGADACAVRSDPGEMRGKHSHGGGTPCLGRRS